MHHKNETLSTLGGLCVCERQNDEGLGVIQHKWKCITYQK